VGLLIAQNILVTIDLERTEFDSQQAGKEKRPSVWLTAHKSWLAAKPPGLVQVCYEKTLWFASTWTNRSENKQMD
jgi:hypothetical protein